MSPSSRNYILATLAVIIAVVAIVFLTGADLYKHFSLLLVVCAFYPLAIFALNMYQEGRYYKWVNGMDWAYMSDQQRTNSISYMGKFMIVSMAILSAGIALVMVNFLYGIIAIAVSVILVFIPVVKVEKAMETPFVPKSAGTKVALFIAVSALALVPCALIESMDLGNEAITVEFGEDSMTISAPFSGGKFDYSGITELGYDPEFQKGSRQMGYGTPVISSGKYKNDVFGSYTLMSYTQIHPCIFFHYGDGYYAFNMASDEATLEAYELLKTKVGTDQGN